MILADSTIVVDYLRRPTPRLRGLIGQHHPAICGVTTAEIHAGARTAAEHATIETALLAFGRIAIPDDIWQVVGGNIATLRARGITVPFADAVIATVALENDLDLWTYDAHFPMIQSALPGLKLFIEPP